MKGNNLKRLNQTRGLKMKKSELIKLIESVIKRKMLKEHTEPTIIMTLDNVKKYIDNEHLEKLIDEHYPENTLEDLTFGLGRGEIGGIDIYVGIGSHAQWQFNVEDGWIEVFPRDRWKFQQ